MLNKMSPFITIIFAAVFLKEYVMRYQIVSIIIAFLETLLIIKPAFNLDIVSSIAGILSAGLLPYVTFFYEPMTMTQWIYLLAAGFFATIDQVGITVAYKYAPPKDISIFFYGTVVYSGILSILVFGEISDFVSILGYLAIFGASFYLFIKNNQQLKEVEE